MNPPITSCWNDFDFLSLSHPVTLQFEDQDFPTLRHALEATKTPNKEERGWLATKYSWDALRWGIIRPDQTTDWWQTWIEKLEDWTLLLVAQKYGLVHSQSDYRDKLKYGYWLACTQERPLIMAGVGCDQLWGTCYCQQHCRDVLHDVIGQGQNIAGQCMEVVRRRLISDYDGDDVFSRDCDWCFNKKKRYVITPGSMVVLYRQNDRLVRRVSCHKHRQATITEARHHADRREFHVYPIEICPAGGTSDTTFFKGTELPLALPVPVTQHSYTPHWPASKDNWGIMRINPGTRQPEAYSVFEAI